MNFETEGNTARTSCGDSPGISLEYLVFISQRISPVIPVYPSSTAFSTDMLFPSVEMGERYVYHVEPAGPVLKDMDTVLCPSIPFQAAPGSCI